MLILYSNIYRTSNIDLPNIRERQGINMDELRPTPILKGKSAKRFYREINDKSLSKEQEKFLKECVDLLKNTKR